MSSSAAITGIGCVSAHGIGVERIWRALLDGEPAPRTRRKRADGTCGISLDITERKRVEQALAERTEEVSQRNQELADTNATLQQQIAVRERIEKVLEGDRNLLRTLIDSLPDYVYAKDAEGRQFRWRVSYVPCTQGHEIWRARA